jgi:hypothetical protein
MKASYSYRIPLISTNRFKGTLTPHPSLSFGPGILVRIRSIHPVGILSRAVKQSPGIRVAGIRYFTAKPPY